MPKKRKDAPKVIEFDFDETQRAYEDVRFERVIKEWMEERVKQKEQDKKDADVQKS